MISAAHHGMMAMASTDDMSFVEYLESSGTQYIDTGIKQAADIEIQAEYMPVGAVVTWGTYFGCGYQDKPDYNILGRHYGTTSNKFNPWFANSDYTQCQITVNTSSKIRVTLKSGSCTAGGTTGTITSTTSGLATSYNMFLFSANDGMGPWRSQPCRIYSFKVLKAGKDGKGGEVIMDLVPVKKNGVGYMLDRVTWKLFGNAGTGSFKTGGKIYDAEVEYVESTGTQYVDTGFDSVSSHSFKIAMNFALVKRNSQDTTNYLFSNSSTSSWLSCEIDRNSPYRAYANVGSKTLIYCGPSPYPFNVWDTFTFSANPSSQQYSMTGEGGGWSTSGSFTGSLPNGRIKLLISRGLGGKPFVKLKHVEIWDNDTLVRDLISVRVGTDGYMYDRVSGQLLGQGDLLVGCDLYKLGSVKFSGEMDSNLYVQTASQPTVYTITGWVKTSESPTKGCVMRVGVKDGEYGSVHGSGVGLGFGNTSYGNLGNNLIVLREGVVFTNVLQVSKPNTWHHYAMAVNGSYVYVYVDGSLVSSTSNNVYTYQTCFIYLGGFSQAARYADCCMTRCAMWNRVLSASEVAADYADGNGAPSVTSGLEHYWPMRNECDYLSDKVGSFALSAGSAGVTISNDTPFS